MAIYRLETRILGRRVKDKAGHTVPNREVSIVAKAAYRAGQKLKDERVDRTFNYRSRSQEVVHAEVLTPENSPDWLRPEGGKTGKARDQRERLWNAVEKAEKRSDSQLAREFILSLPKELNKDQRIELVQDWCKEEFVGKGFVVDFSLHKSKKETNPHAHILCVLRPLAGEAFGKKPTTAGKFNGRGAAGIGAKDDLEHWRDSWEKHVNASLEQAGRQERVDHRSLQDMGLDQLPQPKIGVDAIAMQRKGTVADPDAVRRVRQIKLENEVMPHMRDIQRGGEIRQHGNGANWWERSTIFVHRVRQQVQERAQAVWQRFVQPRSQAQRPPGMDR